MANDDVSFLDRLTKDRQPSRGGREPARSRVSTSPGIPHAEIEPRPGHTRERQETGLAAEIELRWADELCEQAVPWNLYCGCERSANPDSPWEELVILFSNRVVTIIGRNLHLLRKEIADRKLRGVQEHNSAEIAFLTKEDEYTEADRKKSIIFRITAEPRFDALVDGIRGDIPE
jgi:hypothetical protein